MKANYAFFKRMKPSLPNELRPDLPVLTLLVAETVTEGNPLTVAVELFHSAFWFPTTAETMERPEHLWLLAGVAAAIVAVLMVIGQFVFNKLEGRFAQDL